VTRNNDNAGDRLARKLLARLPESLSEGILRKSTSDHSQPDPSLDALS
jgi:hypothetical protein